ncbi:L,D-transpeptidase [Paenibacillus sp. NFR01]|uniref:L,D-transpeptidase n=1 Tax=Paenibacillus sp. NFR01 TaxID=1566279 RepID=UPI0008B3E1E2|nr:L,D-transpeptidase [Paenibacillus sp. NFR01]SET01562.1 L,D-transpeptidase catalytic domain [Paenibacillus sp. NFR01]
MKNSQHLKAYVQMHPDNKMAWYLLGKEYDKNGQQGKANYCFNQAGEVYEAFERSKVPAEMLREYEAGLVQAAQLRQRAGRRKRIMGIAALLLLLTLVPAAVTGVPGSAGTGAEPVPEAAAGSEAPAADEAAPSLAEPEVAAAQPRLAFTALGKAELASGGFAAEALRKAAQPYKTALLGMERSGKWLLWKQPLPVEATVSGDGDGKTVVQSYDAATCSCQPSDANELKKQGAKWQKSEEQLAALTSAMRAYKNAKGSLPKAIGDLTGAFPGNWLGGATPLMKEQFAPLRAAMAGGAGGGTPGASAGLGASGGQPGAAAGGSGAGSGAQAAAPFFTQPLRIIVDTQKHRLAVASGSILLRNYEVGLGGTRTPEGDFAISDKVVNPNGHDNGEFGSRGMQLSDSNYAIHGTNEPDSIGKDESLGCIRMNRKDIEELFAMVPMGTKVTISEGVLPDELLVPKERYPSAAPPNQTNPHKVYHWLN